MIRLGEFQGELRCADFELGMGEWGGVEVHGALAAWLPAVHTLLRRELGTLGQVGVAGAGNRSGGGGAGGGEDGDGGEGCDLFHVIYLSFFWSTVGVNRM